MALEPKDAIQKTRDALADDSETRKHMEQDFQYYRGEQWPAGDLAKLEEQGRPHLVINKCKPACDLVVNAQSANWYDWHVFPKETGDEDGATLINYLMHHVTHNQDAQRHGLHAFADGVKCGRGFMMLGVDYEDDAQGEITLKRVPPMTIVFDPTSIESDFDDCEFLSRLSYLPIGKIKSTWGPEKAKEVYAKYPSPGDTYIDDDVHLNLRAIRQWNKYQILEHWYKDYQERWYVVNPAGEMYEQRDKRAAEAQMRALYYAAPELARRFFVWRKVNPRMKVMVLCNQVELDHGYSPVTDKRYPAVGFFPSMDRAEDAGLIRCVKDLQRELNKRRTELLHIVTTTSHSGWWMKRASLSAEQKRRLETHGAMPGIVLEYEREIPTRIEPPALPADYVAATQLAVDDIRELLVTAETLGIAGPQETSGKAIALRQRQAQIRLGHFSSGWRDTHTQLGRLLIDAIQHLYTAEKTIRVVGTDGQVQGKITVNRWDPVARQVLNNVTLGKYDVVVGEQPSSPVQSMANILMISEVLRETAQAPPELQMALIEMWPLPEKQKLRGFLQQAMQLRATSEGGAKAG